MENEVKVGWFSYNKNMTPFTDIVICVRATREFPVEKEFQDCVASLVENTSNFRLIFVDDCSDRIGAEVVDQVASHHPTSVVIRTHRQNWFTRAHNKGLRLVRTPRAVTLNCDTVLDKGWLEELYDVWEDSSSLGPIGLVGSVMSDEEPRRWAKTWNPGYCTGHCYLLSMEAIGKAAESRGMPGWYFDEVNPGCAHIHSDVELCYRLNGLGYQTIQSFKSRVGHLGGRSWGHNLSLLAGITAQSLRSIDQ